MPKRTASISRARGTDEICRAWELNGKALPIPNGAPLRLRVPRQLGYKMAKYLRRIDLVASFKGIEGGQGGYWEDQGYQWHAGI